MNFILHCVAGAFIMFGSGIIKIPATVIVILAAKAVFDPLNNAASFVIGVLQDTFGSVLAVWIANYGMLKFAGTDLSWILLISLCFIEPWLSWERMTNRSVSDSTHWIEVGCNVGRVVGVIFGGLLFV